MLPIVGTVAFLIKIVCLYAGTRVLTSVALLLHLNSSVPSWRCNVTIVFRAFPAIWKVRNPLRGHDKDHWGGGREGLEAFFVIPADVMFPPIDIPHAMVQISATEFAGSDC